MRFRFFISYARHDRDPYLDRFLSELLSEVQIKSGLPAEEVGFLDRASIRIGDEWDSQMSGVLSTTPMCVSICSPGYLNSENCGKEYQYFLTRYERQFGAQVGKIPIARVIFPVMWYWAYNRRFPNIISRFQYAGDEFPDVYAKEGLRFLAKLNRYQDAYRELVDRLARQLVKAWHELPDAADSQAGKFDDLPSAWGQNHFTEASSAQGPGSPSVVRCSFVVGSKDQIATKRALLSGYDDQDTGSWRPYHPQHDESIRTLAESAIYGLKLRYAELPFNENFVSEVRNAARLHEPVLRLIDPRSVGLQFLATHPSTCDL